MEKNRILLILVIIIVAALFILGRDGVFGLLNINKPVENIPTEDIKMEKTEPTPIKDKESEEIKEPSNEEQPKVEEPQKTGGSSGGSSESTTFTTPLSVTIKTPIKVGSAEVSAGSTSQMNLEG